MRTQRGDEESAGFVSRASRFAPSWRRAGSARKCCDNLTALKTFCPFGHLLLLYSSFTGHRISENGATRGAQPH